MIRNKNQYIYSDTMKIMGDLLGLNLLSFTFPDFFPEEKIIANGKTHPANNQ